MHEFLSQFSRIIELIGRSTSGGGEGGCPSGWLSRGRCTQPTRPAMVHFSLSLAIHSLHEKSQITPTEIL